MIRVGTAGWSIPRHVAEVFSGAGTHLERYSRVLDTAEINTSFHRPHASTTYAGWAARTPRSFRFAVKLPQAITHEQRMRRARAALVGFLAESGGLGSRRGPLLIQLPPSLAFERRTARGFFALLRDLHEGPVVCEPRHRTWFDDRVDALFDAHQIGRVAADPAIVPAAALPGGWPGLRYFRLHGSPRMYWSEYDEEALAQWATVIRGNARGIDTWCIFDNTAGSAAMRNALSLANRVRRRRHLRAG